VPSRRDAYNEEANRYRILLRLVVVHTFEAAIKDGADCREVGEKQHYNKIRI
jgi:hypothetical protein